MDLNAGEGVSVYAEAKGEYTRQLCQYLVPALQSYFLELLEDAKLKEPEIKKVLLKFQQLLEEITDWNVDKVQRETSSIITSTNCDYLDELMTAVFIAHTKVLSAIRLTTKQKKLQITIPKIDHFIHRTLSECSRILWSNTFLFSESGTSIERQKNMRQIESCLTDGVLQAIRTMLPVKSILREYLKEDPEGEEEELDEVESVVVKDLSGGAASASTEAEEEQLKEVDTSALTTATTPKEEASASASASAEAEAKEEAKAEAEAKLEAKAEAKAKAEDPAPTIIVDTSSSPKVNFTGVDSVFDMDDPDKSTTKATTDEENEQAIGSLKILDTPLDTFDDFEEFEDLDEKNDIFTEFEEIPA
jgi:hypothetical protein